ncbi:MAG: cyclic nucleotide-binding domain-containing protein [Spirochaetes bacterium]|nr:cyclic nucleotide-binding domain-containing protein [Spirochaetota bacterium]
MGIFSNITLKKKDEEIAGVLNKIYIFSGLTPFQRAKIAKYFRQKDYEPKARIVKEGEPGDGMFVIKSGAVKIAKQLTASEEKVLANVVEGDFFGEMALLDGSPRSASVYAVSKVTMLELYRASLLELLEKEPAIGVKVMYNLAKILGDRIRQSGDKIRDILVWQSIKK